jgi:spoIIIJ-associated protein
MNSIERTGASIEEVIRNYKKEFKVKEWELRYDVITRPSSGFLGLGRKKAKLRFHQDDLHVRIKHFVEKLLSEMGVGYSELKSKTEGKTVYVDIIGCSDPGFMIGKNGNMLETLQFLVNRIFESERKLERVYLDLDGYRERKEAQFLRQYIPQFKNVEKTGKTITLPLMNPADRRIIHKYIERVKSLKTLTVGEGETKRVVIFSSRLSEKDALAGADGAPAETKEAKPRPQRSPKTTPPPTPKEAKERHEAAQSKKPNPPRVRPAAKPQAAPEVQSEGTEHAQAAAPAPRKRPNRRPPRKKVESTNDTP